VWAVAEVFTLYMDAFWASPFDFSVFVALREKQIEFGVARAILRSGQGLPAGIRQRTVTGRVPALQHGNFWLSESLAIVEYLDELYPPPASTALIPTQPRQRARARQIMAWVRTELMDLRRQRPSWRILYPAPPPEPLGQQAQREADELVEAAERLLTSPDLDFPAEWCMAHADLTFVLLRLVRTGHELPAVITDFVEQQLHRPSVAEYFAHPRPPNPPG